MGRVQGLQFNPFGGFPKQNLGHDFPETGSDHNAVVAANGRRRRHDDDIAVAVNRLHAVAGDFQGVGRRVPDAGKSDFVPTAADGEAAAVEKPLPPAWAKPIKGMFRKVPRLSSSPRYDMNSPTPDPVAARIFDMLSVLGQRNLPSLDKRLLLLNVVGSSPAFLASRDVEPYSWARRSMASPNVSVSKHGNIVTPIMATVTRFICLKY